MNRIFVIVLCLCLIAIPRPGHSEQLDTYRRLKEWTPYFLAETEKAYSTTHYEFSRINIGSRKVEWQLLSERLSYKTKNLIPYLEFTHHDRDRFHDFTLDAGSYFRLKDTYLRTEVGFGMETDFIYRFQTTTEAEHSLIGSLFAKIKARYLHYRLSDVMILSPVGLTYYFGNHYVTADYNFSVTESRGEAHFATAKANFVLHSRLHVFAGMAVGERLFDMATIKAPKQESYIFFGGIDFRLLENLQLSFGYSYSEEQPSFIKRSFDTALSYKF